MKLSFFGAFRIIWQVSSAIAVVTAGVTQSWTLVTIAGCLFTAGFIFGFAERYDEHYKKN